MRRSKKLTFNKTVEAMATPKYVCVLVPLNGVLSVKKEEEVNAYQRLAVADNVYYFSPCSGFVLDILEEENEQGEKMQSVVIQNDGKDSGSLLATKDVDVKERVLESGLSGVFEGEEFLLTSSDDKYYVNNDDAILRTFDDKIIRAVEYVKSFASICTDNKVFAKRFGLTLASEGKKVSLENLYNLYIAVEDGVPYIYKIITVSGEAVKEPKVLRVAMGVDYGEILDACGGEVFPLAEYNKIYNLANEEYAEVLDLKEELKTASDVERPHIMEELVTIRKKANQDIITFLKTEKKYKNVILHGLVYGDYKSGVESEDFDKVVSRVSKAVLLMNKKQFLRRKKK